MTKKIFLKIFQIATTPAKTVEGAALILTVSILLSRILGLIRYRLLASEFGDEIVILDSFLAAANVPEIIFEVLIFGAISVSFIPVFSSLLTHGQKEKAWKLAQTLLNFGLLIFIFLSLILIFLAPKIGFLVAPGLVSQNPEVLELIGNLIRVMVIAQLFFLLGIFSTSILQSHQNFIVPAIAPAIYNLGIIFGIVTLSARFGIFAPALGMVIGAAAFFIIQLTVVLKLGPMFSLKLSINQPEVINVIKLAWPRVVGLSAARGIDWINIALVSLTGTGAIVAFNFAQTLVAVPVGLFGASIAQAALPTLSSQFAKKDLEDFKKTFVSSLHQILFLTLPIISIFAILRIPAIRLVFGAANFPWETTLLAGKLLIILSVSIVSQAALLLLVRAFYAMGDARTPIFAGLTSFFFNVILAIVFIPILKLEATFLALAFSLSSFFYTTILFYFFNKSVGGLNLKNFAIPAVKMLVAAILAASVVYLPFKILDFVLDTSRAVNVLILTLVSASLGLTAYFVFNLIFGVAQASMIQNFFARLKFPKKILTTETFKT